MGLKVQRGNMRAIPTTAPREGPDALRLPAPDFS